MQPARAGACRICGNLRGVYGDLIAIFIVIYSVVAENTAALPFASAVIIDNKGNAGKVKFTRRLAVRISYGARHSGRGTDQRSQKLTKAKHKHIIADYNSCP